MTKPLTKEYLLSRKYVVAPGVLIVHTLQMGEDKNVKKNTVSFILYSNIVVGQETGVKF